MKVKYKGLAFVLLAILIFAVADNILKRNEEAPEYPYIVLNGKIFFDSNDNLKIDGNDTLITEPLKLEIIPYIPSESGNGRHVLSKNVSYQVVSKDGYYKFLVPPDIKELSIRLSNESIKYLRETFIANQSGQKKPFQKFWLINFGSPEGASLFDDEGTIWSSINMNSTADILVVGIK